MFKIKDIDISGAILAPMAGFTDVGFRDLAALCGASLTVTEMVSAKGMVYGNEKTKELLAIGDNENIVAAQIFGRDPYIMADAVAHDEFLPFQIIDINMGCPVPKIVKNGEGSALLNNPKLAGEIVKAVVSATKGKPITVKTRLGFNDNEFTVLNLAHAIEDAGASALTVHGRTRSQFYSGEPNYKLIAKVVKELSIPVIANGDVVDLASYDRILNETGAAGVAIGRAAIGNPMIFSEVANGNMIKTDTLLLKNDIKSMIYHQINVLKGHYDDRYIYSNMKKHICYYLKGMNGVRALRNAVCRVESLDELYSVIDAIDFTKREICDTNEVKND